MFRGSRRSFDSEVVSTTLEPLRLPQIGLFIPFSHFLQQTDFESKKYAYGNKKLFQARNKPKKSLIYRYWKIHGRFVARHPWIIMAGA